MELDLRMAVTRRLLGFAGTVRNEAVQEAAG
jgi:hypothetical protein